MSNKSALASVLVCFVLSGLCVDTIAQRIGRKDVIKMGETRETMRELGGYLRTYSQMNNGYPEKLDDLTGDPNTSDAWGNTISYERKDKDYQLTSFGSDGKKGGDKAAKDILWTSKGLLVILTEAEEKQREEEKNAGRNEAAKSVAQLEMIELGILAVKYRKKNKKWPGTAADLKPKTRNKKKQYSSCFEDSWGNAYIFKALPHENFAVICYGQDGKEDGTGVDTDFSINEKEVRRKDEGDNYGYNYNYNYACERLTQAVHKFKKAKGTLPKSLSDLVTVPVEHLEEASEEAKMKASSEGEEAPKPKKVTKPLLTELPKDDYGNDYILLISSEDEFHVVGLGKDQKSGGKGEDVDIVYPVPGTAGNEGKNRRFR